MTTNLSHLKELLAKATQRPWIFHPDGDDRVHRDMIISGGNPAEPDPGSYYVVVRDRDGYDLGRGTQSHIDYSLIVAAVNALPALLAEREALREALRQISEGRGRFSLDHHQHAKNTIEDMKQLAFDALAEVPSE